MKTKIVFMAIVSLFLAVTTIFAQDKKAVDFSGNWELNVGKSKLGERSRIESMTMTVSQTGKELKVESKTKNAAAPEGERGGGMGRGGFGGGEGMQPVIYSLVEKETTIQMESPAGKIPINLKASWEKDNKLKLSSIRTFDTPNGSMTMTVKETWSLSPDGKTLTVVRERETPRGSFSTEMVFDKK